MRPAIEIQEVARVPPAVRQPRQRTERCDRGEQQRGKHAPSPGRDQEEQRNDGDQRPALVARQRRRDAGHARQRRPRQGLALAEPDGAVDQRGKRPDQHRFRHRGGLQVQQVRVQGEDGERRRRRGGVAVHAPGRREQEQAGRYEADRRGDRAGQPGSPERVGPDKGQHQQVRQRQPDRPDLRGPRRARIQHPPGDVEVGLGIPVVERVAVRVDPGDRRRGDQRHQPQRDEQLRSPSRP